MREIHGHGGWRPGSGRKKGSKNRHSAASVKRYREIAAEARDAGLTPLNYMLSIVRDETAPEHRRDEMAYRAAPYCHPKLTSLHAHHDVRGEIAGNIYVEQINVVSVPSGHHLSAEEAAAPIVEEIISPDKELPDFLALEDNSNSPGDDQPK
jgi:hypothetical protein